jgi:hypothetical protein
MIAMALLALHRGNLRCVYACRMATGIVASLCTLLLRPNAERQTANSSLNPLLDPNQVSQS